MAKQKLNKEVHESIKEIMQKNKPKEELTKPEEPKQKVMESWGKSNKK